MRYTAWFMPLVAVACTEQRPLTPNAETAPDASARHADASRDAEQLSDAAGLVDASVTVDAGMGVADASKCQVTTSAPDDSQLGGKPSTDTWSYDPITRRLVTAVYAYDLDEAGRTWRVYGISSGQLTLYWTNHYDTHGHIDRYEHYTSGIYTFTNTYDGDRLVSVERAQHQDEPADRTTYHYDDPKVPSLWTKLESDANADGTVEYVQERTFIDGRTAVARTSESGVLHHELKFSYAGDRIDTIERDGGYWPGDGPDGTPNMRFHWKRDARRNVVEFTQDGTDSLDNPFVSGVPDYQETFSAGCAQLLAQFPWLAHEPAPNSIGPRFRDDAD